MKLVLKDCAVENKAARGKRDSYHRGSGAQGFPVANDRGKVKTEQHSRPPPSEPLPKTTIICCINIIHSTVDGVIGQGRCGSRSGKLLSIELSFPLYPL